MTKPGFEPEDENGKDDAQPSFDCAITTITNIIIIMHSLIYGFSTWKLVDVKNGFEFIMKSKRPELPASIVCVQTLHDTEAGKVIP